MAKLRAPRNRQRGNSLLLAMIVMSALATLGGLTVVSVQGSLKASTTDRTQKIAMYAAESGAAAAIDFLRHQNNWNGWMSQRGNPNPIVLPFNSNNKQPGDSNNLFSPDQNAWYTVSIYNDPYEGSTFDGNFRVIVESTGHGPQNSVTVVDWEIQWQLPPFVPGPLVLKSPSNLPPMILIGWHIVM
jgi:Tfp pilus assembly protein PilX